MTELTPEMQERIARIMANQQAEAQPQAEAVEQPPAPPPRPPSMMDHLIALRREVAALRQELNANSQVTDAVGNAVGQLYTQAFATNQQAPLPEEAGDSYSERFSQAQDTDDF